jgi:hypothetical protein
MILRPRRPSDLDGFGVFSYLYHADGIIFNWFVKESSSNCEKHNQQAFWTLPYGSDSGCILIRCVWIKRSLKKSRRKSVCLAALAYVYLRIILALCISEHIHLDRASTLA